MAPIIRTYNVEPTPAKFHASQFNVRGLMGPIGSGKSVACCMEIGAKRAREQAPNSKGVRKTKWAVIRNTYGELKSTTIQTWIRWFPDDIWPIVYDSPIRTVVRYGLPDGTKVECEVYFVSMDSPKDVKKVLSMELTGVWVNEARELDYVLIEALFSRTGRYPDKAEAPLTWSGLIMDTNPPDTDHWWYQLAEVQTPDNWQFFRQPAAVLKDPVSGKYIPNPLAENVGNQQLGYDYWLRNYTGLNDAWMKIYCCGEYGFVQEGMPVFPEYMDSIHFANSIIPFQPLLPLILGFDYGLTPSVIFAQYNPAVHQIKWIDEITSTNMGLRQMCENTLLPRLRKEYPIITDLSDIYCVGDPAGSIRGQTDEVTCEDILKGFGFNIRSAKSNSLVPRMEAMKSFLTKLTPAGPAFLVSSKCATFRAGLLGKYCFERIKESGSEARYKDSPVKNRYSHIQDGGQYVAMECEGGLKFERTKQGTVNDFNRPVRYS